MVPVQVRHEEMIDPRVALRNVTGEPLAESQRQAFASLKQRVFAMLDGPTGSMATRDAAARVSGD